MQVKFIGKNINVIVDWFLNIILPPRCIVSGDAVQEQGMLAPHIWSALDFITDPYCKHCGVPFEFDDDIDFSGSLCSSCLNDPPPFQYARSPLKYNDASRNLILGFKHGDQTHAIRAFLPWIIMAGASLIEDVDLIAPVPLHHYRLIYRRYNQAGLIAQALSQEVNIPCIPDLVKRRRSTVSQGHLPPQEREKNVKNAFEIHKKHYSGIQNKTILLIDDVYTTGATVKECARALQKSGAANVRVLTLARVVKGDFY